MINWKVVVGSGAAAAVLSLLTGIISGVSFGTFLIRALMWGVIFCGVGTGISYLISKYLPELFSLPSSEGKDAARPKIDIVLPDENPHTGREIDREESLDDADFARTEPVEELGGYDDDGESPPATGDNLVEEVEELEGPLGRPRQRSAGSSDEGEDGAEELPDLEGDTDDFSATGERSALRSNDISDISSISGRSGKVDVLGLQTDSEELAQAIRTALKKDQKG